LKRIARFMTLCIINHHDHRYYPNHDPYHHRHTLLGVSSRIYLLVPVGQEVQCVGAQLAVVVATSEAIANQAAALVNVTYVDIGKSPISDIYQAIDKSSFYKLIYPVTAGE